VSEEVYSFKKKPYEKPRLIVYGDIRVMTQAVSTAGGQLDGMINAMGERSENELRRLRGTFVRILFSLWVKNRIWRSSARDDNSVLAKRSGSPYRAGKSMFPSMNVARGVFRTA
jgi:hypothetical protein